MAARRRPAGGGLGLQRAPQTALGGAAAPAAHLKIVRGPGRAPGLIDGTWGLDIAVIALTGGKSSVDAPQTDRVAAIDTGRGHNEGSTKTRLRAGGERSRTVTPRPTNVRPGTQAPLAPLFNVLCGIAIVLAACGNATTTATVGPSSTAAAGLPGSPTLPVTPTPAPNDTASAPAPSGTSAFTLLRMAAAADSSKPAPDSTTFTQTFPTSAPVLYVVFALTSGLTGKVSCAMSANGVRLIEPLTIDYGSNNSWGDFKVRSRGTFVKGDYRATLTYIPTGEVGSISFTVK